MSAVRVIYVATVDLTVRFLLLGQLLDLQKAGFQVSAACASGPWAGDIRAAGVPVHHAPLRRDISPLTDLMALARLVALFRRERPDIVHTHTPKANLLGRLAARLAGVPIVVGTEHGFYFYNRTGLARSSWLALARLGAAMSDALLLINNEDMQTARSLNIAPPSKLALITGGVGVDVQRFAPGAGNRAGLRSALGIPVDAPVAGIVGRLDQEKGFADFMNAAAEVRRGLPGARFLAVGPADRQEVSQYEAMAASLGLADAVIFTGMRTDMPDVYAALDLLCLPSRREGLPVVLMEAAAMGLPVVASDIRGCRDVVEDGVTGILTPPGDVAALAGAMREILTDRGLAAGMGRAARRRAETLFDQQLVFAQVRAQYRRLLNEKGLSWPQSAPLT